MPDHFALLGVERRPWLDPDALKEKFHALTAAHHPDVSASSQKDAPDFAAINAAFNALREPQSCLRHLLELEAPDLLGHPAQPSGEIAALFMQLGGLQQELAGFFSRVENAGSFARALLSQERLSLLDQTQAAIGGLDAAVGHRLAELHSLDAAWPRSRRLDRLCALHQDLAYLAKWKTRFAEALFQLQS